MRNWAFTGRAKTMANNEKTTTFLRIIKFRLRNNKIRPLKELDDEGKKKL